MQTTAKIPAHKLAPETGQPTMPLAEQANVRPNGWHAKTKSVIMKVPIAAEMKDITTKICLIPMITEIPDVWPSGVQIVIQHVCKHTELLAANLKPVVKLQEEMFDMYTVITIVQTKNLRLLFINANNYPLLSSDKTKPGFYPGFVCIKYDDSKHYGSKI